MEPIRIFLADPQTLFREGLKALFAAFDTVAVVGESSFPHDVIASLRSTTPDLVLMEVSREACQIVRNLRPETKVAFLTNRQDEEALAEYQESGATGYILKNTGVPELLDAIRTIHAGGNWISAGVHSRILSVEPKSHQSILTPREQEVLKLTAEGNSVKEIAAILDLSSKTVDAHKVNLMRKLRIHNKAQLVQYAFQNQILKLTFHAHT